VAKELSVDSLGTNGAAIATSQFDSTFLSSTDVVEVDEVTTADDATGADEDTTDEVVDSGDGITFTSAAAAVGATAVLAPGVTFTADTSVVTAGVFMADAGVVTAAEEVLDVTLDTDAGVVTPGATGAGFAVATGGAGFAMAAGVVGFVAIAEGTDFAAATGDGTGVAVLVVLKRHSAQQSMQPVLSL